jgi:hypothetical protein
MDVRQGVSGALLYAAVSVFAVWFGGQVFNALMVVPVWSASMPDSVVAAQAAVRQYGQGRWPFFAIFNPLWVTLMLGGSLLLGRGPAGRAWVWAFALCSAASALAVLGWMAPAVGRTMRAVAEGSHTPADLMTMRLWVKANWARLALELCGLLCALRALRAGAAASAPSAARERAEAHSAAALGRV